MDNKQEPPCSHFIRTVKVAEIRPMSFCNIIRDEACCHGEKFACIFHTIKKVKITMPTRVEVYGAAYGPRKRGW